MADYIAHYGMKKQKWGVRRYQNPDGTYTEEGKKRRRFGKSDELREETESLSTEELKKRTERLNAEANYERAVDAKRTVGELRMQKNFPGTKVVNVVKGASTALLGVVALAGAIDTIQKWFSGSSLLSRAASKKEEKAKLARIAAAAEAKK